MHGEHSCFSAAPPSSGMREALLHFTSLSHAPHDEQEVTPLLILSALVAAT